MMRRLLRITTIGPFLIVGCARATMFERYVSQQEWLNAAREFTSDSSLMNNDRTLYQAGAMVYGTPGLPTYDPIKSRHLLSELLARFPETGHRADATGRALLLDEVLNAQRSGAQRERDLEAQIATLTRESHQLRGRIDSATHQSDSLRSVLTRVENDRKEKETELRALRLELQRLKEIDLKPRTPTRPPPIKP